METRLRRVGISPRGAALIAAFLFLAALSITGCRSEPPTRLGNSESITEGRRLYAANCIVCHGEQGDQVAQAPLNQKQFLESRGDALLLHHIAEGKGLMPAWVKAKGGPLTYAEIDTLVDYLDSVAGRAVPSLLANSGRNVYQQQCSRCHGDRGDRIPVAPLAAKPFVDSFSDDQLIEVVSDGKGLMPAFRAGSAAPLSENQLQAVVSYLRYNAQANVADESRRGRELYVSNCLPCHGERGDRVPNVALASPDELRKLGDGGLTLTIAQGKGVMPAFAVSKGGTFNVAELAAILAYLKSWAGLPAGAALTVAMPTEGRDLYLKNCTGCHGEAGDKVAGVSLTSHAYLDGRSDDALVRLISQGSAHGMPAWGQTTGGPLSHQEIQTLLSYLRSTAKDIPMAVAALPDASAAGTITDSAKRGQDLFRKNCAACHGEGRAKVAGADLSDAALLHQRGDDALAEAISFGKGSMPSWGKERGGPLSQGDIAAILAFLKSIAGSPTGPAGHAVVLSPAPAAPAAPTFTGDAATGQRIFAKNCVACHGEDRDKMAAAKLADASWLKQQGDAALMDSIANGKASMPSWSRDRGGVLGHQDIAALIAFLKAAAGMTQPGPAPSTNPTPVSAPASPPSPATTAAPPPTVTSAVAKAEPTPSPAPQSAPTPTPPASSVATSAEPDTTRGKELYTKNCAACHGVTRDKLPAAKLADAAWLQAKGAPYLAAAIATGGGKMMAWGKENGGPLDSGDIAAIVAYLRSAATGSGG